MVFEEDEERGCLEGMEEADEEPAAENAARAALRNALLGELVTPSKAVSKRRSAGSANSPGRIKLQQIDRSRFRHFVPYDRARMAVVL